MINRDKEQEIKQKKLYYKLYTILWILVLVFVGAFAHANRKLGGTATFFDMLDVVQRGGIFHWLNPLNFFACLKWSIFYWIGILLFSIYEEKFKHDAAGREAGSAHWNDKVEEYNETHSEPFGTKGFSDEPNRPKDSVDDSWKEGKVNNNNPKPRQNGEKVPPVPGNPNMIESMAVRLSTADMKTHLNNNVFIVGGAGTGKSRFFIKPNVLQMNCSYVVTDPSGELLKSMHNVLTENGYKIKVFNLVNMMYSCKYNPFNYVRSATDVSILVDCFISNTTSPDQKSGDPFWDKSEKALLSSLIFYLVDIADEKFRKFSTILWMVQLAQMDENGGGGGRTPRGGGNMNAPAQNFSFSIDSPLDELFNGNKKIVEKEVIDKSGKRQKVLDLAPVENPEEMKQIVASIETSLCLTNYKTFKLGGTKTLKSILISAAVRLNPFSIPAIHNLTDDDTVELEMIGDQLTCFFAIIPQTNSTFNFLISMLFSQMFEALYYKGGQIPDSRLNYHVRFLLDEFANIGKIPEFPQKISTCRKYNISTTIVLQSIAQIKMLYKDDYETIIGNCDTAICLGTNEQTTADYFSKKLGKSTITSKSRSFSVGGKGGANSSFQQTARELMMPDEIMTIPFDECIVMMNHISPFYDKKYPLEMHPQFDKTGDADKKNFYFLENDPTFLCVKPSEDIAAETINTKVEDNGPENEHKPQTLQELLKEDIINNPDEDGYFIIRDADEEDTKSAFEVAKEMFEEALDKCANESYKTVFFNAEYTDPMIMKSLLKYGTKHTSYVVNDIFAYCNDIYDDEYIGFYGTSSLTDNVVLVLDKLAFINKQDISLNPNSIYIDNVEDILKCSDITDIEKGCKLGESYIKEKKRFDDINNNDDNNNSDSMDWDF